ncbi:GNAT family N-acetyltransferase [Bacillus sp. Marseille-P3800]|uniref:GNAT family N-acetyltransferase n=1 Tax=Bacillus sp. Marseille-P3800 TaxID=2014782 RepID=UPI000C068A58|nr:GNAT family N-acetyltransferase [Bacillus sp. Marseille-P3800]
MYNPRINLPIKHEEVPSLREKIGWARRDQDFPALLERCNFWVGVRNEHQELIGFGYVCGMGLEHGYLEDIMVHPHYQGNGIGVKLVKALLVEADAFGLEIVTVSYGAEKQNFYEKCGFTHGGGGVWSHS